MSQIFSPSERMVNAVNNAFAPPEIENIDWQGGRAFCRAADTVLTPVAFVETVVFAAFTMITSFFSLFERTNFIFEWAQNHTVAAGSGFKNALARIFRPGVTETPAPVDPTPLTGKLG